MEQPRTSRAGLFIGLSITGIIILAIAVGAAVLLISNQQQQAAAANATAEAHRTATAQDRATGMAQVEGTVTAQAGATATSQTGATATSRTGATATSQTGATATSQVRSMTSTVQAGRTATAAAILFADVMDGPRLAGPLSGEIEYKSDGYRHQRCADIRAANFAAQVTFTAPYEPSDGTWSVGLVFRTSAGHWYLLAVQAGPEKRRWALASTRASVVTFEQLKPSYIRLGEGRQNTILLIANGFDGDFYLNGYFIADLALGEQQVPGNVCVSTNNFPDDYSSIGEGKVTRYMDFTVWQYP